MTVGEYWTSDLDPVIATPVPDNAVYEYIKARFTYSPFANAWILGSIIDHETSGVEPCTIRSDQQGIQVHEKAVWFAHLSMFATATVTLSFHWPTGSTLTAFIQPDSSTLDLASCGNTGIAMHGEPGISATVAQMWSLFPNDGFVISRPFINPVESVYAEQAVADLSVAYYCPTNIGAGGGS